MNHAFATKFLILLSAGGLAFYPVGCGGQDEPAVIDLRVDNRLIDRDGFPGLHSYAGMLRQVQPAVVSIYSERMVENAILGEHPALRRFFGEEGVPGQRVQSGVGSGVIVSPQGHIMTNNHVIEGAERIIVQLADDREVEAEVIGRDPATDIAVLQIVAGPDLPTAVLTDSDQIEVGDVVFALGNSLGIGHAVTSGIISARGRTGIGILGEDGYEDFIQTDASMNVGNSGGPLVDSSGRVIGINTAIASPGGGNVGIGFAIPINMARSVMRSLIETGEVRRGYLGLTLKDPDRGPLEYGAPNRDAGGGREGVLVVTVAEDSPASEAGLREGDFLTALDDKPVGSANEMRLRVAQLEPGTDVEVEVIREGETREIPVILGRREEAEQEPEVLVEEDLIEERELLPGLTVAPLTPELRQRLQILETVMGLLVTSVAEGSPHIEIFPVGAVILQINRQPVETVEVAEKAIFDGQNFFLVWHEGMFHYLMIEVETS